MSRLDVIRYRLFQFSLGYVYWYYSVGKQMIMKVRICKIAKCKDFEDQFASIIYCNAFFLKILSGSLAFCVTSLNYFMDALNFYFFAAYSFKFV